QARRVISTRVYVRWPGDENEIKHRHPVRCDGAGVRLVPAARDNRLSRLGVYPARATFLKAFNSWTSGSTIVCTTPPASVAADAAVARARHHRATSRGSACQKSARLLMACRNSSYIAQFCGLRR